MTAAQHEHVRGGGLALAVGALGVVYGDLGTSPLYSIREALERGDGAALDLLDEQVQDYLEPETGEPCGVGRARRGHVADVGSV